MSLLAGGLLKIIYMEKDKIIIRLYEMLEKEEEGEITIGKSEEADWEEGLETGRNLEKRYFKSRIKRLINEIKTKQ